VKNPQHSIIHQPFVNLLLQQRKNIWTRWFADVELDQNPVTQTKDDDEDLCDENQLNGLISSRARVES
jgi:hypothetical protein